MVNTKSPSSQGDNTDTNKIKGRIGEWYTSQSDKVTNDPYELLM